MLAFSCSSTGFLMAKPKVTLFGDKYPPKDQTAHIEVFMASRPSREYTEFARITCADSNDKWSIEQIKKKAREIGADGIIIIGKAGSSGLGVPSVSLTYVVSEDYGMVAVAFRYKQ